MHLGHIGGYVITIGGGGYGVPGQGRRNGFWIGGARFRGCKAADSNSRTERGNLLKQECSCSISLFNLLPLQLT